MLSILGRMTLTPDDLPGDGAQQVICSCTSEAFKIVLTAGEVVGECLGCGSTANRFPALTSLPGAPGDTMVGPGRDTLGGGGAMPGGFIVSGGGGRVDWAGPGFNQGGASAGAAWGSSGHGGGGGKGAHPPAEDEIRAAMARPAPLPAYSPETCNVYLSGGDYDGQVTWLAPGLTEFYVRGMQGKYVPDPDCEEREGRAVWRFVPSMSDA